MTESKFTKFAGNKDCPKCHGEGAYMYDNMHGKICELCCTHPDGFGALDPEFYGEDCREFDFCIFGCGAKQRK